MDEKEKDLNENLDLNNDVTEANDDTLEEKDGVKYETNDNWVFDAEAPTLNNDMFEGLTDGKAGAPVKANEPTVSKAKPDSNQIVINKEPLKFIPLAIFLAAVITVLIVLGVRYYTVPNGKEGDLANPAGIAYTVDDTNVSVGLYNLYFSSVAGQYESYAAYGYYDLNTADDYTTQYTTDDDGNEISWFDLFKKETDEQIKMYVAYSNAAKKEGITLSQAQKDIINEQVESFKSSASEKGMSLNEYIQSVFGDYCTIDTIKLYLEQYYLTVNYKGVVAAEFRPTDEEISKYYDEHKQDYYQINFSYLACSYDSSSDEAKAESEKTIKDYMSKITDRKSILSLVPTAYKDYIDRDVQSAMEQDSALSEEEARKNAIETYESNVDGLIYSSESPFGEEINNWLFDENQPTGTVKYYVNEETGYAYIILKTEQPSLVDDETYTVRHILITPESDDESQTDSSTGSTTYTDEQWAEAEKKANSILEQYNSGEKTEASFAALAEENSADSASLSVGSMDSYGGLCEGVTLGSMVSEFEDWAIDDSRKYGDVGIVKSQFGYHIMFFINDKPSYESQIIVNMRNEKLNEIIESAEYKTHNSAISRADKSYLENKKAANAESATTDSNG